MWFHMGIFPMNILATSHSSTLDHDAMVWFLNVPQGLVVDVEGLVFLGDDGKLCNVTFRTCAWRRCCDPDSHSLYSSLSSHHGVSSFLCQSPFPPPTHGVLPHHRHTDICAQWPWTIASEIEQDYIFPLRRYPPPPQVFVKVTDYLLIYRYHGVIISPYKLITFIVSVIPI